MPSSKHSDSKSIKSNKAPSLPKSASSTPRHSVISLNKSDKSKKDQISVKGPGSSASKHSQKKSILSLDKLSFHKSTSLASKRSKSLFSIKEDAPISSLDAAFTGHQRTDPNSLRETDEEEDDRPITSEDEYSLGEGSNHSLSDHSLPKSTRSLTDISVNRSLLSADRHSQGRSIISGGPHSDTKSQASGTGSERQAGSVSGKTATNAQGRSKKKDLPEELVPLEGLYSLEEVYFGRPSERELSNDKKLETLHQNMLNFKGFLYSNLYGRLRVSDDLLNAEGQNFTITYDRYNTRNQFLVKCKIRRKPIFDFNIILFTDLLTSCFTLLNQYRFHDAVLYFPIGKPKDIGIKEYFFAALYVTQIDIYWQMLREDIFKSSERRDGRITSRFHSQASVFKTLEGTLIKAERENITPFQFLANKSDSLFLQPASKKKDDPLNATIVRHASLPLMGFKCSRPPTTIEDAAWLLEFMRTSFLKTPNVSKVYICMSLAREFKFSRHRNVFAFFDIPSTK